MTHFCHLSRVHWKLLHSGWFEVWLRQMSENDSVVIAFIMPSAALKNRTVRKPCRETDSRSTPRRDGMHLSCFYCMTSISRTFFHPDASPHHHSCTSFIPFVDKRSGWERGGMRDQCLQKNNVLKICWTRHLFICSSIHPCPDGKKWRCNYSKNLAILLIMHKRSESQEENCSENRCHGRIDAWKHACRCLKVIFLTCACVLFPKCPLHFVCSAIFQHA